MIKLGVVLTGGGIVNQLRLVDGVGGGCRNRRLTGG